MNRTSAIHPAVYLAAIAALAGAALWAGTARAENGDPAARAPVQVVVVNAPAAGESCGKRGAYGDCDCYRNNATSVTVLDAPFQPGAMYFVNQPVAPVRYGRGR